MSKKKLTIMRGIIAIVTLCMITVLSSCSIGVKSLVSFFYSDEVEDKVSDEKYNLDSGYYTYYYPVGVIPETEYKELDEENQALYTRRKNLYLNHDPVYGIIDDSKADKNENGIVDEFEKEFDRVAEEIAARYAAKGYPEYRVSVIDDFALRIEIPASQETGTMTALESAYHTFGLFAETDKMTIVLTDAEVSQLEDNELTDIIKEFSVYTQYDTAFLKVTFTDLGKAMLDDFAYEVEAAKMAGSSSSVEEVTLNFMVGDEAVLSLTAETIENGYITSAYEIRYPVSNIEDIGYVETLAIMLNSILNNAEGFDIEISPVSIDQVHPYQNVKK